MATHIGRREFISGLGGGAVTWPVAALAQQPERLRRIAVVTGLAENDPQNQLNITAFRQGLQRPGVEPGSQHPDRVSIWS
jgi:putative tryptophan/tyrosine transport system substrate-binding protein